MCKWYLLLLDRRDFQGRGGGHDNLKVVQSKLMESDGYVVQWWRGMPVAIINI